ncbi:uncharacterized protein MELLADRAFT_96112 [Melampsora larici-populina 98AG31]|uniref:Uncharacterized protein n=1 Tax=Melampsora larici-populina (strain 98AG31 / pathotype 3-4-7) TaxID=747676 RepID=F4SB06_MELLP|nr:uncharacterized protein MELLADRAFT_96112 [Melampsora larici-populina 98AG31]EGF98172.1 hypothetical protein MELLADRAFT_96112 [Melampsora larici-populina 98AG31]
MMNSGGKKQHLEENDSTNTGLGEEGLHGDEDSEDEDSDDGDLTQEDILERKRKRHTFPKKQTESRHQNTAIGKVAQAHLVPKAATPLARAIHDFARMLLGIPRKAKNSLVVDDDAAPSLPDPPTDEEPHNWESRNQVGETLIRNAQEKAMRKYLSKKPPNFKPNQKQRKMVEKDAAEAEVLRRWVGNKGPKFKEQIRHEDMKKTADGKKNLQESVNVKQGRIRQRRNKEKLYKARLSAARKLFGKDSNEVVMLSHPEIHLDDELANVNDFGSRQRLRLEWRSAELDTLISLLDQFHMKRQTLPKTKRAAKALVERGAYAPEPDPDQCPSKGFQESLVSPAWLDSQAGLLIEELNLDEEDHFDIKGVIKDTLEAFRARASVGGQSSSGSAMMS